MKDRRASLVPVASVVFLPRCAEDVLFTVIGGAGKHPACIPTGGATRAVTRALKLSDGRLAKSMGAFRRG